MSCISSRAALSPVCPRVQSNPANPAFDVTFNPEYKTLFEAKPSCIPTFGLRIASLLEQSNLHPDICTFRSNAPPWTLSKPTVDLSLHVNIKDTTDPIVYQTRFTDILLTHDNFGLPLAGLDLVF